MMIKVSAVIPAYNRENTLQRAIESVLNQSFEAHEVIVVDDGSTDGTFRVAEQFAAVKCFRRENIGAAGARNYGVEQAGGDWIAFLDSDDVWEKDHLKRVATAIEATNGRALLYFANVKRASNEGGGVLWRDCGYEPQCPYEFKQDSISWAMLPLQPTMVQASVVSRSAFIDLGGFREGLLAREDTHFFFRMCAGRPACAVCGVGVYMGSAEKTGMRLSTKYHSESEAYVVWTIEVYKDLLISSQVTEKKYRDLLRQRLCRAYMKRSKQALSNSFLLGATQFLFKAVTTSPQHFAVSCVQSANRYLRKLPQ